MKGTEEQILHALNATGIEIEVEAPYTHAVFYFENWLQKQPMLLCRSEEDAVNTVRNWMISDMEDGVMVEHPKYFQKVNLHLGFCEDIPSLGKVYRDFLKAMEDEIVPDNPPYYRYGIYSLLDDGEKSSTRKNLLHEGEEEE